MIVKKKMKKKKNIINKNNFLKEKQLLNLDQQFAYESLLYPRLYHYEDLKDNFIKSNSITRKKCIIVPKDNKRISNKISYLRVITCYNSLPNNLKTLTNRSNRNVKLKEWIIKNQINQ